jgi:hypothetical protein
VILAVRKVPQSGGYGDTLFNPLLSEDPLGALLRWFRASRPLSKKGLS